MLWVGKEFECDVSNWKADARIPCSEQRRSSLLEASSSVLLYIESAGTLKHPKMDVTITGYADQTLVTIIL